MRIVLIGYGKMGKAIERLALGQGHEVIGKIEEDTSDQTRVSYLAEGDVAIEFSHPSAAYANVVQALNSGIPTVSGTTGWLDRFEALTELINKKKGSFFYASNYSIGVNIMFAINETLAAVMDQYGLYDVSVEETHHIHKKDAPSGTALTLANDILDRLDRKNKWSLEEDNDDVIKIDALRRGEVYGDHKVTYTSSIDTISLSHSAHTRDGFAQGALLAASWLHNNGQPKKGIHSMKEMMGL